MIILRSVPRYGDHNQDVKDFQEKLSIEGFNPGPLDGWFGDATLKALQKFQKSKGLPGSGVIPVDGGQTFEFLDIKFSPPQEDEQVKPLPTDNYFGAPWIGVNIDMLGRKETDPELNARYVPEWKKEGLGYTTLSGNSHAWCSLLANANYRAVGVKGTDSAAASSWSKWGKKCPFWFGASLPIQHAGGGRHKAWFLYWIDEAKSICAQLGGNQGDKYSIVSNNLSGKADTLVGGSRWSTERPDGLLVPIEKVLEKYPHLKVGGTGGSTR